MAIKRLPQEYKYPPSLPHHQITIKIAVKIPLNHHLQFLNPMKPPFTVVKSRRITIQVDKSHETSPSKYHETLMYPHHMGPTKYFKKCNQCGALLQQTINIWTGLVMYRMYHPRSICLFRGLQVSPQGANGRIVKDLGCRWSGWVSYPQQNYHLVI